MANRADRPRPSAYPDANEHGRVRLKPVVLSTGRGSVKLTAAEARELAAELEDAADDVDPHGAAA